MTETHDAAGEGIDHAPASIAPRLDPEREVVLKREEARAAREDRLAEQLAWQRGIIVQRGLS